MERASSSAMAANRTATPASVPHWATAMARSACSASTRSAAASSAGWVTSAFTTSWRGADERISAS